MSVQSHHGVLPETSHDEQCRQDFAKSMRAYVTGALTPGNRTVYERHAKPQFLRRHNRPPETRQEMRRSMLREPYHQAWSALMRSTQESIWDSVGDTVERQLDELIAETKAPPTVGGSLTLNPNVGLPPYLTAVDIHCMPGNYTTELAEDDVFAGALYDRGVYVYFMGGLGSYNQVVGEQLLAYINQSQPGFQPKRILDMGCSVGHSTLPYTAAYPEAEIHAIDVGAAMLRYAHGRAESLGCKVHFSQQNAEHTDFADESFDLVVSHIMMHERSNRAIRNIMQESRRLLRPGGLALHLDIPTFAGDDFFADPFNQYLSDWNTHFNAEPFIGTLHEIDKHAMSEAGFTDAEVIVDRVAMKVVEDGSGGNYSHHTGAALSVYGGRRI